MKTGERVCEQQQPCDQPPSLSLSLSLLYLRLHSALEDVDFVQRLLDSKPEWRRDGAVCGLEVGRLAKSLIVQVGEVDHSTLAMAAIAGALGSSSSSILHRSIGSVPPAVEECSSCWCTVGERWRQRLRTQPQGRELPQGSRRAWLPSRERESAVYVQGGDPGRSVQKKNQE